LYFNPEYDFLTKLNEQTNTTWTVDDVLAVPISHLLPSKVDVAVFNMGIHLHVGAAAKTPMKNHFIKIKKWMHSVRKSGLADRIIWRVTFPGRARASSPRAPIVRTVINGTTISVASVDPLPSPPSVAVDGAALVNEWRGRTGFDPAATDHRTSQYYIEVEAMTSPEMRAIGVEVLDVSQMIALRSDAHDDEKHDSSSSVHSCLPGPLDDVNSLILNRMCYAS
jgi:hypothetical protein